MKFSVVLRPRAKEDLVEIFHFIAADNPVRAKAYVERIRGHYEKLCEMPQRGAPRSDIADGIRLLSFEGRVAILYRIEEKQVRILRILYGGKEYPENPAD